MAYVPDDAIRRFNELTAGEQALYLRLCVFRCGNKTDENYGLAFPSRETLCAELGMVKEYVSQLMSGLVVKGWIKKQGWKSLLIVGFENPEKSENSYLLESKKILTSKKMKSKSKNLTVKKLENELTHIRNIEPIEPIKNNGARKPENANAVLMKLLTDRFGKIPDGAAQGSAIKWLLAAGYTVADCEECFEMLCNQSWRTTRISWLTVRKEIGTFKARKGTWNGYGQQRSLVEDRLEAIAEDRQRQSAADREFDNRINTRGGSPYDADAESAESDSSVLAARSRADSYE